MLLQAVYCNSSTCVDNGAEYGKVGVQYALSIECQITGSGA